MVSTRTGFLNRLFSALRAAPEPGTSQALTPVREAPIAAPVNEPEWVPTELAPPVSRRGFLHTAGRAGSALLQAQRAPLMRAGEFLTGPNVDPLVEREVGGYLRGLNDLLEGGDEVPEDVAMRLLRANQRDLDSYDLYMGVPGQSALTNTRDALMQRQPEYFSNLMLRDLSRRWQLGSPEDTGALRSVVERGIGQPLDDVFRPFQYHPNVWSDFSPRDIAEDTFNFGPDTTVLDSREWYRNLTTGPRGPGRPSLHQRYAPTLEPRVRHQFDEALGEAVDRGWVDEGAYLRSQGYEDLADEGG